MRPRPWTVCWGPLLRPAPAWRRGFPCVRPRNTASAVRWHGADGFVVIEVVAELGHVGLFSSLPSISFGLEQTFRPQPVAHLADQGGVFGPAFRQDVAHAVQHGKGVSKTAIGVYKRRGFGLRIDGSANSLSARAQYRLRGRSCPWCDVWAQTAGTGLPVPAWWAPVSMAARSSGVSLPALQCF